jgi:hypothetical protein
MLSSLRCHTIISVGKAQTKKKQKMDFTPNSANLYGQ